MTTFAPTMSCLADPRVLHQAYSHVQSRGGRTPGPDGLTIKALGPKKSVLRELGAELLSGRYSPGPVRPGLVEKRDGTSRPILVPNVRDRIVERAAANCAMIVALPPTRGFGVGWKSGVPAAVLEAESQADDSRFAVRTDIVSFYSSCRRSAVIDWFAGNLDDGRFVNLLEQLLNRGIINDAGNEVTREGLLPGCALSSLGAEIYLAPAIGRLWDAGIRPVRYVDDIFVGCESSRAARKMKTALSAALAEVGLRLAPEKTGTYDLRSEGAPFLGFRIFRFFFSPDLDRAKSLGASIRSVSSERDLRSVVKGQVHAFDRGVARKEFWSAVKRSAKRPAATKLFNQMVRPTRSNEPETMAELQVVLKRVRGLERAYRNLPTSKFCSTKPDERFFIVRELERHEQNR